MLQRGFDGGKGINGRKRFVVVDTLGYGIEVTVLPASVPERAGAETIFWDMVGQEMCASLELVLADGGFEGQAWQEKIYQKFGLEIEVIKRNDDAEGFELLPQRWIVERSLDWMNYYRRLSKDYEGHCHLSRSWMLWAMINKKLFGNTLVTEYLSVKQNFFFASNALIATLQELNQRRFTVTNVLPNSF